MAHSDTAKKWLAWRRAGEEQRLRAQEEQVALQWYETLSPDQRELYDELSDAHWGLLRLRSVIRERRGQRGE